MYIYLPQEVYPARMQANVRAHKACPCSPCCPCLHQAVAVASHPWSRRQVGVTSFFVAKCRVNRVLETLIMWWVLASEFTELFDWAFRLPEPP